MRADPLRVLVVDDTVVYRKVISDILAQMPGVEVVGVAANGRIALQKIDQLRPDLLTLDLEMPELDGLGVLRHLQQTRQPVGAIMLSAFTTAGADATIAALKLGAFDFVLKPATGSMAESAEALRRDLQPKLEAFARSRLLRAAVRIPAEPRAVPAPAPPPRPAMPGPVGRPLVVAIGISTGGPQALTTMLPMLPGDLAVPVLIVQHMPPKFTRSLAEDLNSRCVLKVSEGQDGQRVSPGEVVIAPGGAQMRIERSENLPVVRITDDPPENSCRPSVDYLFRSVAHEFGGQAVGVIMTGMGSDGTLGCRLLKRRGATIVTQDEATCVVYGMPRAPAEEGLSDVIAPLDRIAPEIVRLAGKGAPVCR